MAKRSKIKSWVIDAMVDAIEAGEITIDKIKEDNLRNKVAARIATSSKPEPVMLTGSIKRESEKAIYFVPTAADSNEFRLEAAWWPKSQIQIFERAMGPCDQIDVPEWLLKEKAA